MFTKAASSRVRVDGHSMAYRELGDPDSEPAVLFLHGNPTSSYIWRDVMPPVAELNYCLAPDLIGFGESDKPDIGYRFADHARFLSAFVDELSLSSVVLVAQDWGTALALDLACRRPELVVGLAFMEFIRPMATWDEFHQSDSARELFKAFRRPGIGEALILEQNLFVERVLPGSVRRKLLPEEHDAYRRPFPTPESRRPILALPRELPIEGEPADVAERLSRAHEALRKSRYPKILFHGDPGALVSPQLARETASALENCELVALGDGAHYLQEDHGRTIGREIAGWLTREVRNGSTVLS